MTDYSDYGRDWLDFADDAGLDEAQQEELESWLRDKSYMAPRSVDYETLEREYRAMLRFFGEA